jgi:hypothetical protein
LRYPPADFNDFRILLLGRLLGGIATSLLFSIFEAWLIRSHADANVNCMLGKSFSWAAYGNSVVAIFAGLVANKAANQFEMISIKQNFLYAGGYLNPFDIAFAALLLCGFFALALLANGTMASRMPSPRPFAVQISTCAVLSAVFLKAACIFSSSCGHPPSRPRQTKQSSPLV